MSGKIAPPAIAIISKEEPIFVNLPKPSIAKGKIAGHIKELANPNKAIQSTAVYPVEKIAPSENNTPKIAHQRNAAD